MLLLVWSPCCKLPSRGLNSQTYSCTSCRRMHGQEMFYIHTRVISMCIHYHNWGSKSRFTLILALGKKWTLFKTRGNSIPYFGQLLKT